VKRKIFSADIGSGFTKTAKGLAEEDQVSFPSIVTPFPTDIQFELPKGQFITLSSGEKFLTGDTSRKYGRPNDRYETTNDSWHGETFWKILLYQAIANNFKPDEINETEITVGIGLPQKIFSDKKEKVQEILDCKHQFNHGDDSYSFSIKSVVAPQAAAALIYNGYEDSSLIDGYVGVIEVGTHTTGMSAFDDFVPVTHESDGVSIGMCSVYAALSETLKSKYGYTTDLARMPAIVKERRTLIAGEQVDLGEDIDSVADRVSKDIIPAIKKIWGQAKDKRLLITGGGMSTFFAALKEEYPHLKSSTTNDPFFDVALGLYSYAKSKSEDS